MDLKRILKPVRFLLIGLVLYIGWVLLHEGVLKPRGIIDPWLTNLVSINSVQVLNLMGYEVDQVRLEDGNRIVNSQGEGLLRIAYICDGLELYVIFLIFLLAFPGPWKDKLWYVPMGFVVIYIFNQVRVVSLILTQIHAPQYLHFNHKYTFVIIVYGVIFLLWMIWVRKFGMGQPEKQPDHE